MVSPPNRNPKLLRQLLLPLSCTVWLCTSAATNSKAGDAHCPQDMVDVGSYCIDRYESSARDIRSRELLSPYYPPEPPWLEKIHKLWEQLRHTVGNDYARSMPLPVVSELQRSGNYKGQAVSAPGLVPQGYLSYYSAKRLCEASGKRLCTEDEWSKACRGENQTQFPYGRDYQANKCNVASYLHPAAILHGLSSSGHLDPRLNLLMIAGDAPVLRETGATPTCASRWGSDAVFDMVGNLDEWVADDKGMFRGGFYARRAKNGCDAEVTSHPNTYFDYSTGARCCRDAAP
jgi:Sulfatase-modifying factor enzyme 1